MCLDGCNWMKNFFHFLSGILSQWIQLHVPDAHNRMKNCFNLTSGRGDCLPSCGQAPYVALHSPRAVQGPKAIPGIDERAGETNVTNLSSSAPASVMFPAPSPRTPPLNTGACPFQSPSDAPAFPHVLTDHQQWKWPKLHTHPSTHPMMGFKVSSNLLLYS